MKSATRFSGSATLLVGCALISYASAQTIDDGFRGTRHPAEKLLPEPEFVLRNEESTVTTVPPPQPARPYDDQEPRFALRGILIEGNKVVKDKEFKAIAAANLGKPVTFVDLENLRNAFTRLYIERGFVSSGVLLPPQKIADGVVRFVAVEGKLSNFNFAQAPRLPESYISERLSRHIGNPLFLPEVANGLRLLTEDPLIEGVHANIRPSEKLGFADLDLELRESPPVSLTFGFDNHRASSVDEMQSSATVSFRNALGLTESIDLHLWNTSGFQRIEARASYPLNASDARLHLSLLKGDSELVEENLRDLNIKSTSTDVAFGMTYPFYRTASRHLTLGAEFAMRHQETTLLGRPFSLSAGAIAGETDVSVARFTQDWVTRSTKEVFAARSTFSFGLPLFDSTRNKGDAPDSRFFAWLGQAQWAVRINPSLQMIVKGELQLTPDPLLAMEKYGLGGARSVRGYRENEVVRDNGGLFSGELRIPLESVIPAASSWRRLGSFELAPFVDVGRAWDTRDTASESKSLLSAGFGLRWQWQSVARANLYYAKRINRTDLTDDGSYQADGIHFQIRLTADNFF